jgi:protein involved in polysaccharide export with SLBB domain
LLAGGWCALAYASFASGCASKRDQIAQALGTHPHVALVPDRAINETYRLGYPDSVEIAVVGMPECSGNFPINVEGRIQLAKLDNPRVDGQTVPALRSRIARELGVPNEQVHCRAIGHESRVVFVHGAIEGGDRAVRFQGPESVISLLRRCGGLQPSADVRDVHVVRSNVALGLRPQVFAVDLEAILLRGEPGTDVLLQPFDEVSIGELPRAKVGRALPDFLRPAYRGFCTVLPWLCPHDWQEQIRESPAPEQDPGKR